jgi:hypothetical protein
MLIPYGDEIIGHHQCGFRRNRSTTDQIFYIRQILEKKWEYNGTVQKLFKKAYDSVRREVLYNILIEFGIPRKLVELIKMCLHETYSRVCICKNLSDKFSLLFRMAWNKEMLYHHCFWTLLWNMPSEGSRRTRRDWYWMGHISFWPTPMTLI